MLNRKKIVNLKSKANRGLLAFTLLISFFTVSAYVNSSRVIVNATNTEVLADKPFIIKSCIGYKRASLAFYRTVSGQLIFPDAFSVCVLRYNNLVAGRYQHLKRLFFNHKSVADFQLTLPSYPIDQDHLSIG